MSAVGVAGVEHLVRGNPNLVNDQTRQRRITISCIWRQPEKDVVRRDIGIDGNPSLLRIIFEDQG